MVSQNSSLNIHLCPEINYSRLLTSNIIDNLPEFKLVYLNIEFNPRILQKNNRNTAQRNHSQYLSIHDRNRLRYHQYQFGAAAVAVLSELAYITVPISGDVICIVLSRGPRINIQTTDPQKADANTYVLIIGFRDYYVSVLLGYNFISSNECFGPGYG